LSAISRRVRAGLRGVWCRTTHSRRRLQHDSSTTKVAEVRIPVDRMGPMVLPPDPQAVSENSLARTPQIVGRHRLRTPAPGQRVGRGVWTKIEDRTHELTAAVGGATEHVVVITEWGGVDSDRRGWRNRHLSLTVRKQDEGITSSARRVRKGMVSVQQYHPTATSHVDTEDHTSTVSRRHDGDFVNLFSTPGTSAMRWRQPRQLSSARPSG